MMLFIYGFCLLYLMDRVMGYNESVLVVLVIASIAMLLLKSVFVKRKIGYIFIGSLIVVLSGISYYLYRIELLMSVMCKIADFFKIYYLSIVTGTIYIKGLHVHIILLLLSLGIYRISQRFRDNIYILLGINGIVVVLGMIIERLSSRDDRAAFINVIISSIILYFYQLYKTSDNFEKRIKSRKAFIRMTVIVTVFVMIFANILYIILPNPFMKVEEVGVAEVSRGKVEDLPEYESKTVESNVDDYKKGIDDSFDYDFILLMLVEAEKVSYLKSNTYEYYMHGEWYHNDHPKLNNGRPVKVYNSEKYEEVDYEKYYYIDPVKVEYKNIITNSIFINTYGSIKNKFGNIPRVLSSANRGIYYLEEPLEKGYEYEFDAVVPRYGSKYLTSLITDYEKRYVFEHNEMMINAMRAVNMTSNEDGYVFLEREIDYVLSDSDIIFYYNDEKIDPRDTDNIPMVNLENIYKNPNSNRLLYYDKSIKEVVVLEGEERINRLIELNVELIDPEIVGLTMDLTEKIPSYYMKALAVEKYLKTNYIYDEDPYDVKKDEDGLIGDTNNKLWKNGKDKVSEFLFTNKKGFCQHYASAMTLMLKSIGIEARYVTGYRFSHYEELEEEYTDYDLLGEDYNNKLRSIYDSNAHAWVEAYFPEVGWIMFEPTSGMEYFFEKPNNMVNGNEIATENNRGVKLGEIIDTRILSYGVVVTIIIVVIGLIVTLKIRRRRAGNEIKLRRVYGMILTYLNHRNAKKYDYETPREYADRIDKINQLFVKESFSEIIHIYEGMEYGNKKITDDELEKYCIYLKAIKKVIKRHTNLLVYTLINIKEFLII